MDLILWRHAEAEDGYPDRARKLTTRGHKHAARMAEWLMQRLPAQFTVLASPAERTRQTALALGVGFETLESLAPGATVDAILAAAGWPANKNTVIVVGHQPDLGCTAAALVAGAEDDWALKKGGLWWLSSRVRDGEAQVIVRAAMAPDLL
ncbi:MAG: histidine phosphatase family protein [Betaproteobacteria bacterium]